MIESKNTRRERHVAYMGHYEKFYISVRNYVRAIRLGRSFTAGKDNIRCLVTAYVTRAWTSFVWFKAGTSGKVLWTR